MTNDKHMEEVLALAKDGRREEVDCCVNDLRYSECIKRFPLKENMTLNDILHISYKREVGSYETCYITVKQLKDAIVNL